MITQTDPAAPRDDRGLDWGQSLSTGAAGIALLHIENARAGTGEWSAAHAWASAMTRSVNAHPEVAGLFRGAPAVAFALHAAEHPAYAAALRTLDGHITTLTMRRLDKAHDRIDRGRLPALREFDLISGLTGIGCYLLHRHGEGDGLRDVLTYLVRMTHPLKIDGAYMPGWWCGHGPDDRPSREWLGGHGNFGLAHGIAGPLALLATAMRRGLTVTGQAEAINQICAWLDQWRIGAGQRAWWPEMISLPEWRAHTPRQPGPGRPSWCYGTPGLAHAQHLAGLALADPQLQQRAEQALLGCVSDEAQLSQLTDASLCHGWAGLVHTTWRLATDAHDSELADHLPRLRARWRQHVDEHAPPAHEGLLEGSTGIRLAQRAAATEPVTRWDACLLLDSTHPPATRNIDQLGSTWPNPPVGPALMEGDQ